MTLSSAANANMTSKISYDIHGIDIVRNLKWMNIKERYQYLLGTLMYKCVNKTAPSYLVDRLYKTYILRILGLPLITNYIYLILTYLYTKKVFVIMVLCSGITFLIILHQVEVLIVLNSILKIILYHRYELSHAFYFASCIKYVLMCFCLVIFTYLLIYCY